MKLGQILLGTLTLFHGILLNIFQRTSFSFNEILCNFVLSMNEILCLAQNWLKSTQIRSQTNAEQLPVNSTGHFVSNSTHGKTQLYEIMFTANRL